MHIIRCEETHFLLSNLIAFFVENCVRYHICNYQDLDKHAKSHDNPAVQSLKIFIQTWVNRIITPSQTLWTLTSLGVSYSINPRRKFWETLERMGFNFYQNSEITRSCLKAKLCRHESKTLLYINFPKDNRLPNVLCNKHYGSI